MWSELDLNRLRALANLMRANVPLGNLEAVQGTYLAALVAILHLLSPEALRQVGIALLGTPLGPILGFLLPMRILLVSLVNPMIWIESYRTLIRYLGLGIQTVRRERQQEEINELTTRVGQVLLRFD